MFCSKCGKENDDAAQICFSCGNKFNETQTVQAESITNIFIMINVKIFSFIGIIFRYLVGIAKFVLYIGCMLIGAISGRFLFGLVDNSVFWSVVVYGILGLFVAYLLDQLFLGQITTTIEIDKNLDEINLHLKEFHKETNIPEAQINSVTTDADDYSVFIWVCFWVILVGISIGGAVLFGSFLGFILGLIVAFIIDILVFGFIATTLSIDKKVRNLKTEVFDLTKRIG